MGGRTSPAAPRRVRIPLELMGAGPVDGAFWRGRIWSSSGDGPGPVMHTAEVVYDVSSAQHLDSSLFKFNPDDVVSAFRESGQVTTSAKIIDLLNFVVCVSYDSDVIPIMIFQVPSRLARKLEWNRLRSLNFGRDVPTDTVGLAGITRKAWFDTINSIDDEHTLPVKTKVKTFGVETDANRLE
jgi:hypothetical protein